MFDIKERSFIHKISLFKTIILGIGSTIGAGIFLLLSTGVSIAGPGIILAFIINAIIALIIAGNYAEGASFTPVDGVVGQRELYLTDFSGYWEVLISNYSNK